MGFRAIEIDALLREAHTQHKRHAVAERFKRALPTRSSGSLTDRAQRARGEIQDDGGLRPECDHQVRWPALEAASPQLARRARTLKLKFMR